MASSVTSTLLTILSLLAIAATTTTVSARPGLPFHPCNTLIVSTYSFSLLPNNPNPNPNPSTEFFIISAELHPFRHRRFLPLMTNRFDSSIESPKLRPYNHRHENGENEHDLDLLGFSSLRGRTKDILSVVASLLFGAACGALTAGTMYLIWSLFNPRHEGYGRSIEGFSSDEDGDDDDDDVFNPKKDGNVAIPVSAPPAKVVDSIPAAAPAGGNGGAPAAA